MRTEEDQGSVQKQSIFGACANRKKINFVPASVSDEHRATPRSLRSVGEQYLSLVLQDRVPYKGRNTDDDVHMPKALPEHIASKNRAVCTVCNLPISGDEQSSEVSPFVPHDLSIAHQICVQHSYPPSHLDRKRQGLRYLSSYGWDVDSRKGLGAAGEGRQAPVKAKAKNDTVGLGMKIPENAKKLKKPKSLDAGRIRKKDDVEKRRAAKLNELFYRNDDVEKYLGCG